MTNEEPQRFWTEQWPDQSCALFRTVSLAAHTWWIGVPRGSGGRLSTAVLVWVGERGRCSGQRMVVLRWTDRGCCQHYCSWDRWTYHLILISGAMCTLILWKLGYRPNQDTLIVCLIGTWAVEPGCLGSRSSSATCWLCSLSWLTLSQTCSFLSTWEY